MLEKIIEQILKLTEQRDSPSLDLIFLKTVNQLFLPASVNLYDLLDEKGTDEFNGKTLSNTRFRNVAENDHDGLPLSDRGDFCECIIQKSPVCRKDDSRGVEIIIYPVTGEEDVTSLLVLEKEVDRNLDLEKFEYLFRAYSSHRRFLKSFDCDPLTGLLNRRAFERHSYDLARSDKKRKRRSCEENKGTCFAIIDIDHFKSINDTYGHLFGDDILILISRIISEAFRHYDLSFRYGGEEFCIILYQLDEKAAIKLMERFRKKVESYKFPQVGTMTVTVGVTTVLKDDQPSNIIDRADKALYYGKEHGRNMVRSFEELFREGLISDEHATGGWQVF